MEVSKKAPIRARIRMWISFMKAIIMAGGEGSRLRPLTCDCPKPMMRLMDRPVMQYALELLRAHGIREIAGTLG